MGTATVEREINILKKNNCLPVRVLCLSSNLFHLLRPTLVLGGRRWTTMKRVRSRMIVGGIRKQACSCQKMKYIRKMKCCRKKVLCQRRIHRTFEGLAFPTKEAMGSRE